jgi:hypothetical protein
MITFRGFLLHHHPPKYTRLKAYRIKAPDTNRGAQARKLSGEIFVMLRLSRISSQVLQCLEPPQGKSWEERRDQVVSAVSHGDLYSVSFLFVLERITGVI